MTIREARPADVPAIVGLVRELADYERELARCELAADQLHAALFGARPALFAHVADVDGAVVGCALWFLNFSTWAGRHGIYLEDLYVQPAHRGLGLGRALLATLAGICADRGYPRLEWSVLNWNEPSIRFYRALGAVGMDEWTTFRLDGAALDRLGGPWQIAAWQIAASFRAARSRAAEAPGPGRLAPAPGPSTRSGTAR